MTLASYLQQRCCMWMLLSSSLCDSLQISRWDLSSGSEEDRSLARCCCDGPTAHSSLHQRCPGHQKKMDSAVLLIVRKSAWECYRQLKVFTRSAVRKGCSTSKYVVQRITVIVRSAQVNVSSYVPSASIRQ
jgi:hypothetical protein